MLIYGRVSVPHAYQLPIRRPQEQPRLGQNLVLARVCLDLDKLTRCCYSTSNRGCRENEGLRSFLRTRLHCYATCRCFAILESMNSSGKSLYRREPRIFIGPNWLIWSFYENTRAVRNTRAGS